MDKQQLLKEYSQHRICSDGRTRTWSMHVRRGVVTDRTDSIILEETQTSAMNIWQGDYSGATKEFDGLAEKARIIRTMTPPLTEDALNEPIDDILPPVSENAHLVNFGRF